MYLLKGEPLIPLPLLLTKMLSLNAVSIKSMERKLLQAINTKFSDHFPKTSIFWPFFPICASLCMGNASTPFPLFLKKIYFWVLLQWYIQKESNFRLLSPNFPAISLKIEFLAMFSPFVPAHGQHLYPMSAFLKENVITRCCCNDIYKQKATLGYHHPILTPFA